ncbi:MAG: hypothetical protein EOO68_03215 [Moraxellaceae bacterium]|nr:MAG: hypothetical protein EOO68_03215 [Moraxellaceae bacterium]
MNGQQGAMSIAEGFHDYRVDVNLILDGGQKIKKYVLRTTLISLSVWKSKYARGSATFEKTIEGTTKDAHVIDKEVWVFEIDATKPEDIYTAVSIAKNYFNVSAKDIIGDVYVKNLNVESEHEMGDQARINANIKLYSSVTIALVEAAKRLGVSGSINFWIFSNNVNNKIPKQDLHDALQNQGTATSVTVDEKTKHVFGVASNDGTVEKTYKTHLHLATLKI